MAPKAKAASTFAALLLATGCHSRFVSTEEERPAQPWVSSLPEFDAWLGEFLSSANRRSSLSFVASSDEFDTIALQGDDIDFAAIVKAEVEERKPDIPDSCVYAPLHLRQLRLTKFVHFVSRAKEAPAPAPETIQTDHQTHQECIVPLAVKACKEAWDTLMSYCADATDAKSEAACKHYREDPADFLVSRVLRANINPIDGGYSYCWWKGKC